MLLTLMLAAGVIAESPKAEQPLVIAHRGASGVLPEHTLAAYAAAIEQGADVIEPDLIMTKDGVLIARHDIYLSTTTDVAQRPEFKDRARVISQRRDQADWYAIDFTLEELKTLRAVQPRFDRPQAFNGRYQVPTFEEILGLVVNARRDTGRRIFVYPETKSPAWHAEQGLAMASPLLEALQRHDLNRADGGVFIQSFEPEILKELAESTPLPLVQLIYPENGEPNISLEVLANWAHGVGPSKQLLLDASGRDNGFVQAAHELGLFVHPWTFRDDQLPNGVPSAEFEIRLFLELGIDGFFTDFPATGRRVVDALQPASQ